tara:strand:- start:122 stop:247 length:126 start_codon:yes stop_codon:yes gene_type:complete
MEIYGNQWENTPFTYFFFLAQHLGAAIATSTRYLIVNPDYK